ncbi:MAG: hypothetical protein MHMPM18_000521 [Marteilia pararefringens]
MGDARNSLMSWIQTRVIDQLKKVQNNDGTFDEEKISISRCNCQINCCCIERIKFGVVEMKRSPYELPNYLYIEKTQDGFFGEFERFGIDERSKIRVIVEKSAFDDQLYNSICNFDKQFREMASGLITIQQFEIQHVFSPSISEFILIIQKANYMSDKRKTTHEPPFIMEDESIKKFDEVIKKLHHKLKLKSHEHSGIQNSEEISIINQTSASKDLCHKKINSSAQNGNIESSDASQMLSLFENVKTPISQSDHKMPQNIQNPQKDVCINSSGKIHDDIGIKDLFISSDLFKNFSQKYPEIDFKKLFYIQPEKSEAKYKSLLHLCDDYIFSSNIYENFSKNSKLKFNF